MTLITGDRVRVAGNQVQPIPGPGRRAVTFSTYRDRERTLVIPSDALTLVGRGRLDRRLFDVTGLVAAGHDERKDLPLIVTYDGAPATASTTLRAAGATSQRELRSVKGRAARVPKSQLTELFSTLSAEAAGEASSGIAKIWLDGKRQLSLDHSVPQIGAPAAWAAGYTGRGVKVAVLYSGVEATHPDFTGRLQSADFTGTGPADSSGHATHVASIVAGSGAASDGKYKGVAPDAEILSGKVCGVKECEESAILAGMEWAVQQQAKVVNLSLGGIDFPGHDPLEQAVNTLTAQTGTLFVIAAGNQGDSSYTINSPGSAAAALTVGAVDRDDKLAVFSSRGPTVDDGPPKPDVTAPGVDIVAARSSDSQIGEPVGSSYQKLSGTSMATPHVAGAAALLAQQHPDWNAGQLKAALMGTAKPAAGLPVLDQGSGRVDVAGAVALTVTADTGGLHYAKQRWPHHDDVADSKEITYANSSAQPVTLNLTASFTGPDGTPAPSGAVRISTSTVTVPAKGTAKVTITSDTTHDGPDGQYFGTLVATAGATTLATTLSVDKEVESYDLTIRHLDRSGAVTGNYLDVLVHHDTVSFGTFSEEDGVTELRLPKGRYVLDHTITEASFSTSSNLVQPQVDVTSDQVITVDARQAEPVTMSVPEPAAHRSLLSANYVLPLGNWGWVSGIKTSDPTSAIFTAHLGPPVPAMTSLIASTWARPDPAGGDVFADTPFIYFTAYSKTGSYHTGFHKDVQTTELAVLKPSIAAQATGTTAVYAIASVLGSSMFGFPYSQLPATPTVYLTANDGGYFQDVTLLRDGQEAYLTGAPASYLPGNSYPENWGRAVLGPSFYSKGGSGAWAYRTGDGIHLLLPSVDGDGHHTTSGLTGSGSVSLRANGTTLYSWDHPVTPLKDPLPVPAGPADYRLTFESATTGLSDVSTKVQAEWTFKSTTTTEKTPFPLWGIHYRPAVDGRNVLRTGHRHLLPIVAAAQRNSPVGSLDTIAVQTSTDDGRTWRTASVRRTGAGMFEAVVVVPDGARFVSVRTKATDSVGNGVDQTVVRAYQVAR